MERHAWGLAAAGANGSRRSWDRHSHASSLFLRAHRHSQWRLSNQIGRRAFSTGMDSGRSDTGQGNQNSRSSESLAARLVAVGTKNRRTMKAKAKPDGTEISISTVSRQMSRNLAGPAVALVAFQTVADFVAAY